VELTLFEYEISLVKPLWIGTTRKGLYLSLFDSSMESFHWGEIAPLPGFSSESFEEAKKQAIDFMNRLQNESYHQIDRSPLFSSVRCGFDMVFGSDFLPAHKAIPLAGLIPNDCDRPDSDSFSCYKVKVGNKSIDREIDRIKLISQFGKIRVDPNRAWTSSQMNEFWMKIQAAGLIDSIDFIEEPCQDYPDLVDYPLALDESLQIAQFKGGNIKIPRGTQVLVIKPMLVGGIEQAIQWIDFAISHRFRWVISSSFESGLATAFYANLVGSKSIGMIEPSGFDPYRWLDPTVHKSSLQIEGGNLIISDRYESARIDDQWLTPIYTTILPSIVTARF
jgi:O-succinylbenzoate synthase